MTERVLAFSVTLADCDVQTKRGHGNGGQNRNVRETAVRIVHRASGAVGESQEERSQRQNKAVAFRRMAQSPVFRAWALMQGEDAKAAEARAQARTVIDMAPANIVVEVKGATGKWETL